MAEQMDLLAPNYAKVLRDMLGPDWEADFHHKLAMGVWRARMEKMHAIDLLIAETDSDAAPRCIRTSLRAGLRWNILQRDGFRCRYCGATRDETKLHVDHVVPVVAGGTNDPSNLVTACDYCNLGKAAKLLWPLETA